MVVGFCVYHVDTFILLYLNCLSVDTPEVIYIIRKNNCVSAVFMLISWFCKGTWDTIYNRILVLWSQLYWKIIHFKNEWSDAYGLKNKWRQLFSLINRAFIFFYNERKITFMYICGFLLKLIETRQFTEANYTWEQSFFIY